jgi:hypothetical protein
MAETSCSTAATATRAELASHVRRFEELVYEHSDRLRRIELLLDEIAADDVPTSDRG